VNIYNESGDFFYLNYRWRLYESMWKNLCSISQERKNFFVCIWLYIRRL